MIEKEKIASRTVDPDPANFFDLIPDPVCIASTEGSFKKVNAAWDQVLGYTIEELLSISFFDLIHPEDRESTKRELEGDSGGLKARHFINRYRTKSGDYRWLEWNANPADGHLFYATARDVTCRIEAEEQLRLWADTFTWCAHGIAIGIPSTKRIMTCNIAFAEMHGMSIDEISDNSFFDFYPQSEHEAIRLKITELQQKNVIRFESIRLKKDGSCFPVQMDIVNIFDDEGNLVYHITTVQDISERKRVEVALRESEKSFRSVVESGPEAICIQTGGCFAYLNPAALALFGASSQYDLLGRAILERVHPEFRSEVREQLRILNKEPHPLPIVEPVVLRCDGSPVVAEISAVPFTYQGQPGSLVFIRDITSRKKAEAERLQLEMQLFQSQKIESIGQLAGGIAHDLNNLLTPILGYSEMLKEQFADDKTIYEEVRVMHQASLSARELVWKLLAFSRQRPLEYRVLDLNEVITGFEHLLRRTLREDIAVHFRLSSEELAIKGDAGQLEQIMMNLCVNAQDALPQGGQVFIETEMVILTASEEEPSPGVYAQLTVRDTGTGMDAETVQHIFEPFFTTKELGHGTGLGLATVCTIVNQHSGKIRVFSEPGKGSAFRIRFPLLETEKSLSDDVSKRCGIDNLMGSILVVEDNNSVRDFVVRALQKHGHTVFSAQGGREALKLLHESEVNPDLLLTDIVMPGMHGKMLSEKIRSLCPDIKVLYMSGYSGDIISSNGVLDEGVNLLEKPFSVQALVEKVEEMLCR